MQQLESSRMKLTQLEQDLQRARAQVPTHFCSPKLSILVLIMLPHTYKNKEKGLYFPTKYRRTNETILIRELLWAAVLF